jgi:hypothetical protein
MGDPFYETKEPHSDRAKPRSLQSLTSFRQPQQISDHTLDESMTLVDMMPTIVATSAQVETEAVFKDVVLHTPVNTLAESSLSNEGHENLVRFVPKAEYK